jgi:hypothetical protein
VINESLARRLFPEGDAIGKPLRAGGLREVIGVVADSKTRSFGEHDRPAVYLPVAQDYRSSMTLIARVRPGAADAAAAVRGRVSALAPDLPLAETRTLAQHVDLAVLPARALAALLAAFGALALTLAVIGLYGLVATSVRQRRHEIGVRMALGATHADVLKLVVRDGMVVVAAGIAVGFVLALALTRFLQGLLYGVSATASPDVRRDPALARGRRGAGELAARQEGDPRRSDGRPARGVGVARPTSSWWLVAGNMLPVAGPLASVHSRAWPCPARAQGGVRRCSDAFTQGRLVRRSPVRLSGDR